MTLLGHVSLGLIVGRLRRCRSAFAAVSGSIIPDIDFVFLFSPSFNALHRTWSHSIFFILAIGTTAAVIANRYKKTTFSAVFLPFMLGAASHLAVDSILDNNPSNGLGIALFYPISRDTFQLFSLTSIFPFVQCNWSSPRCMVEAAIPLLLFECFLFLYAVAGHRLHFGK